MIPKTLCLAVVLSLSAVSAQKGLFDPSKLRTFSLSFKDANFAQQIITNKRAEKYIKGDLTVDGKVYKDVGVRGRGGQTWGIGVRTGKLPLRLALDEFVPGQRLMGRRSIVLGVCYEASFLREALTFRLMRKYHPAPEANFVKVVCNGTSWGVYLNIEAPNKDFLDEWFEDNDGNRYKGLRFANYGNDPNKYMGQRLMSSPRPDSFKDLAAAVSRLSLTGARHEAEVPWGIDVDGMHRYFACNAFCTVSDTFPYHNFYIYVDPHHDQLDIIPWDVNYSLRSSFIATSPFWLKGSSSNLWTLRYQAHLRNMGEELDINELKKWIADYHSVALAEMQKDTRWFFPTANLVAEANRIVTTMTQWKANAAQTLGVTPVKFSGHTRTPFQPTSKDTVWVAVKTQSSQAMSRVLFHYRSRGYFRETPMFDDGKHNDGAANDGIYGISVPPGLHRRFEYDFSAESANKVSFHPSRAARTPYSYSSFTVNRTSVLISEFLASNVTGLKDNHGEREDWIELLNPTASTIDLSGMHLSDDMQDLKKWKIQSLTLQPGERLLIWADDQISQGPFHAAFKLSKDEDALYLTDKDGVTLRDYYEFSDQISDVSTGRLFDRLSPFVMFANPTPIQPNELKACGSRLFAAGNAGLTPIQLGLVGLPKTNSRVSFEFRGAPPNSSYLMMIGLAPESFVYSPLAIHLHIGGPILTTFLVPASGTGAASVPMTVINDPQLDKFHMTFQALAVKDKVVVSSNGLELRFCK